MQGKHPPHLIVALPPAEPESEASGTHPTDIVPTVAGRCGAGVRIKNSARILADYSRKENSHAGMNKIALPSMISSLNMSFVITVPSFDPNTSINLKRPFRSSFAM